tara:strand:- start:678 stop:1844 length:1167 start_codon:yes stop_codon:yes gene_type:complete
MRDKKKILLILRRGISEIEWLSPVIDSENFNFELYTFYLTKKTFNSCAKYPTINKILNKKQNNYFVLKKTNLILFRLLLRISNFFINKFYDTSYVKKKLNLNPETKFDIVLTEFGNNSYWIQKFKETDNSKIVKVPSTPTTYVNFKASDEVKKIFCDYLIVNNSKNLDYWSRFVDKKNLKSFGVPIFDISWRNKQISKKYNKSHTLKVLFAYSSYFGLVKNQDFQILKDQFIQIMDLFSKYKNIKITFKIHPEKNDPYFFKLLNKHPNNLKIMSNENIYNLSYENDILVTNYESAAAIYGCYFSKPCIEIWKGIDSIYQKGFLNSNNGSLGILKPTKNISDFREKFNDAIEYVNQKSQSFDKEINNFKKIYPENAGTINNICDFLRKS